MYQNPHFLYKGDIRICQNMFFIIPDQPADVGFVVRTTCLNHCTAEAPLFKQSYLMSPLGSGQRSLTSGRACSHNRYTLLFSCLCNRFTLIFVKSGIYGTVNGSMPQHSLVDTANHAVDTGFDISRLSTPCFSGPGGIRQLGTAQGYKVPVAFRQHCFCLFRRKDIVSDKDRNVYRV